MSDPSKTFKVQLVLYYEFTLAELDRILACSNGEAKAAFRDLVQSKHTCDMTTGYDLDEFLKAGGQALVKARKEELHQLTEGDPGEMPDPHASETV